jgi:hypothetical protein
MSNATEDRVLRDLLEPIGAALNEEAARKLIELQVSGKVQARINALARKCNEGELTDDDRAEYEIYVLVGEFLAIVQAHSFSVSS